MANQFPPLPCWACTALIDQPIWMYIGDGQHQPVCPPCLTRIDLEFTAESAIAHADYEVWIWSDAPVLGVSSAVKVGRCM